MENSKRSIGVQVNLCCRPKPINLESETETAETRLINNMSTETNTTTYSNSSNANASCATSRAESQRLSEVDGEPNVFDEEDSRLLAQHPDNDPSHKSPSVSRHGSGSAVPKSSSISDPADPLLPQKRDSGSHSYHFKRKFANFRSDSVFSDVMPMASTSSGSSHDPRKGSDPNENKKSGGSLSSLKPRESKWVSLRKKLKINSSSSKKAAAAAAAEQNTDEVDAVPKNPGKSIEEKRTLFQRAKTLSILPVSRGHKERGEDGRKHHHAHSHMIREPPELFNVGGEMNMIPLEFLINIEDLKVSK